MSEHASTDPGTVGTAASAPVLGDAVYEILRQRLSTQAAALQERMIQLDARRQEVFGRIESRILQADRITTAHNCVPVDMVALGNGQFLFGFNVQFGLKKVVEPSDVFALFTRDDQAGTFREVPLSPLLDRMFVADFRRLYNVYERTAFSKFSLIDGHLYMVFRTGSGVGDIAVFKWVWTGSEPRYVDGRAEAEYRRVGFPPPFEFPWRTPSREAFRYGDHPHVSIEDRIFVECVGGDLTIKVEDNTATGEGIHAEPVEDRHQKVDDAEIAYALVDHLILLRIRPYKETVARHFIYHSKLQTVVRIDSIGQSCALLPEGHGLVFPDGYYLATGEWKRFEARDLPMRLERVIHAPSGEDSLYVFFRPESGQYALMPYRLIGQKVEERIGCHGFSLFANGQIVLVRTEETPQRHHAIQLRQTPFHQTGFEPEGRRDAFLYQVGNKDVVRCLAECNEVLSLARRDPPYVELYPDLARRCGVVIDSYPWLASEEGFGLVDLLREVRTTADKAVDEFAKVRRQRQEAVQKVAEIRARAEACFNAARRAGLRSLGEFVEHLAALRQLRGEMATLREVRLVDVAALDGLDASAAERLAELSAACVQFLLRPEALDPYRTRANEQLAAAERIEKTAEGRRLEKDVTQAGAGLEMLVEIVNGLRIEDPTETTRILDGITAVYATLNRVKGVLKNRLQERIAAEGAAQFNAQLKLLQQSAAGYIDLCDSPAKCDEYLNRLTVQLEEMEGAFAGFEEFTVQLAERRTEFYEAFEQRRIALVEQRNRRAQALLTAAERVLKVVVNRLAGFKTLPEIHAYMVSDTMTAKVRETIAQLMELGDAVKADDLQGRLKSAHQDAVRQLKDRQELFVDGSAVIQLGSHRFNVNTQPLDLTLVLRDDAPHFHLTSTQYFDPVTDPAYLETRSVWGQETVAENASVYRAEFLAWKFLNHLGLEDEAAMAAFQSMSAGDRLNRVQAFMAPRFQEGYAKGVHDADAMALLEPLVAAHRGLGRARQHPVARAMALVFWSRFCPEEVRALWTAKLRALGERNRLFALGGSLGSHVDALRSLLEGFSQGVPFFESGHSAEAAGYLAREVAAGNTFAVTRDAQRLAAGFLQHLVVKGRESAFNQARQSLTSHPPSEFEMIRDWVRGHATAQAIPEIHADEAAALVFCGDALAYEIVEAVTCCEVTGLRGSHPRITGGRMALDYVGFVERLRRFEAHDVPRFGACHAIKLQLLDRERRRLRLDEFRPRILSSFVRNQLIDRVYLPMIGDNLAKQVGAAGVSRRTDLMGLLLLISPPGYGKTTLLEYVASRLGIVFIKINGPAIGHQVTSLDPQEAPNASAREEIHRLNLALEMGDNAMICIDDIQHCHPEFLQKFISLCDGQRRIEGVWRGQPRTYDLRGRRVVVVMAGNPYTESGQKFRIPDMLANRADTYNLGDVIGANAEWFAASYLENAATSNPVLAPIATRHPSDFKALIQMAESGTRDPARLEGSYPAAELDEVLAVLERLLAVRAIVMRVNQEYILSAGQSDEFRTEPPFRLQGSYRNMNRLAEKIVALLNESEVRQCVIDHYRGESQTLTTGAESNLLKFKELIGALTPEETARWDEIRRTFRRNQFSRTADPSDPMARVIGQLGGFQQGLEAIQLTLEKHASRPATPAFDIAPLAAGMAELRSVLDRIVSSRGAASTSDPGSKALTTLREEVAQAMATLHADSMGNRVAALARELEGIRDTLRSLAEAASQQGYQLRTAQDLLVSRARQGTVEIEVTQEMLANERAFMDRIHQLLAKAQPPAASS